MNLFLLILLCIVLIKFLSVKEGMCASTCSTCAVINVESLLNGIGECGKECIDCDLDTPSYLIDLYNKLYGTTTSIINSLYKCSFINDKWTQSDTGDSLCLADMSNNWHKFSDPTPIKCIADYGTEIGELANSKSTTIVKSTKYVCPSIMPTCDNFKCGSTFGTCK